MRGYMDKKILLNKTLRVFLYIEIICISIMILVSGAAGGFYTSSIAAMMIQIGLFVAALGFVVLGWSMPGVILISFVSPLVQFIRIMISSYSSPVALIGSILFFYFFICIGFTFLNKRLGIAAGLCILTYVIVALLYHKMPVTIFLLSWFSLLLEMVLLIIATYVRDKIFLDILRQSDIIKKSNDAMSEIIESLEKSIIQLSVICKEVGDSAANLSDITQENSAALEEISSTIDESDERFIDIANTLIEKNNESNNVLEVIRAVVAAGNVINESVDKVVDLVKLSNDRLHIVTEIGNRSAEALSELVKRLIDINNIAVFVSDIADDISLLALNANIEAARAGDYGKGFAVVAKEITKLANSTLSHSKDIIKTANEITHVIEKAETTVENIKSDIDNLGEVNSLINTTIVTVDKQIDNILKLNQKLHNVFVDLRNELSNMSKTVKQESDSFSGIRQSIEYLNDNMQNTAGTAEELSASVESLNNIADTLINTSDQYNNKEELYT